MAKKIAKYYNTDHNEIFIKGSDLEATLNKLVISHDEPFGDAANIPLFLMCNKLKNDIKVVLQGDGGDELFLGYRRYNIMNHRKIWTILSSLEPILKATIFRKPKYRRYLRFLNAMNNEIPKQMALLLTQDSFLSSPYDIFNNSIKSKLLQSDPFLDYTLAYEKIKHFDLAKAMSFIDCQIQLPNTFLEKVDKPTMANSIEVRVPFLDNNLVEYLLGIPTKYKLRMLQKKWILKKSLKGIVPDFVLNGKKKGFSVPFEFWLKKPLANYMKSVLLDPSIDQTGFFNRDILGKKITSHINGTENNGFILWKALNLAIWHENYFKN